MNKEVVCEFETNTTSTFGKFEVQLYITICGNSLESNFLTINSITKV